MSRRIWLPALSQTPVARAKPLRSDIRVVEVNAPVDFQVNRADYEVEIINVNAVPKDQQEPKLVR
jgi:hypothetical protein